MEPGYELLTGRSDVRLKHVPEPTASVHDSQIDLSQKGETVYRDKGYFGAIPFASIDKTMRRSVRDHPISTKDERRNRAINRTRSLVERPFAVIKRVFHAGHVLVTTHLRVHAKNLFVCFFIISSI
jgi:transposase, IS5 family